MNREVKPYTVWKHFKGFNAVVITVAKHSETNEDFTRLIGEDISGMKIAVPKFYVSDVINPEIKNRVLEIIEFIKSKGVIVDYVWCI